MAMAEVDTEIDDTPEAPERDGTGIASEPKFVSELSSDAAPPDGDGLPQDWIDAADERLAQDADDEGIVRDIAEANPPAEKPKPAEEKPEPAEEKPEPKQEAADPWKDRDDLAAEAAAAFGVDASGVKTLGTPEAVEAFLKQFNKPAEKPVGEPKQEAPSGSSDGSLDSDLPPPLDPDEWDPALVERDKAMRDAIIGSRERLAKLEKAIAAEQEARYQETVQQTAAWFDDQISKLGDDVAAVLGKGPGIKMDGKSKEFANRAKLWKHFLLMSDIDPNLSDEDALMASMRALHPEIFDKRNKNELVGRLRSQSRRRVGTVAPRSQRVTEAPPSFESEDAEREYFGRVYDEIASRNE